MKMSMVGLYENTGQVDRTKIDSKSWNVKKNPPTNDKISNYTYIEIVILFYQRKLDINDKICVRSLLIYRIWKHIY